MVGPLTYYLIDFDFVYRKPSTSQGLEKSITGPTSRGNEPLLWEQSILTTPATTVVNPEETAVLAKARTHRDRRSDD